MPINELVNVDIDLSDPPLGSLDFGTPLIAANLTSPQDTLFGADVTLIVTPQTWQTELAALLVLDGEQLYEALSYLFSQENRPSRAMVGRRATAVAQVTTYSVPASPTNGDHTATINGTASTFAASGSTQAQVRDGLIAAINASLAAARVTATSGGGGAVVVTSDIAGVPFTALATSPSSTMTVATGTANVGLGEDLTAWQAEDPSFYALCEDSRVEGNILTLAAAVEAFGTPKLYLAQSLDTDANTSATDDVGSQLQDLGYYRTAICSHPSDAVWLDAALLGACLSRPAGSITYGNRRITGITGTEYATTTNGLGKRWTLLERFRAAGISATRGGRVAQGTPIDLVIARDAIKALMQTRGLEVLTANPKISYTDDGAEQIGQYAVRSVLQEFAAAPYNVVVASSIELDITAAADQSTTDRGNRHFPGISWSCTLQGAIETLDIQGTMTV